MSHFEYLSVLLSIVVAFAMSEALSGWGQMIRMRDRVRLHPLHLGWTPHPTELGGRDLRAEYFRNRRWIFGLGALLLVELALVDARVAGEPFWHPENAIRGVGLGVLAVLAISENERLHTALLALAYALLGGFVFVTSQAD